MSLAKEILQIITEFAKTKKPTLDPSCLRKFNRIKWRINDDETKVFGKISWKKFGTWTEPFGTVENHHRWFHDLNKHLNEKFQLIEFKFDVYNINANSRTEIISWGTKEEISRESKELANKIRDSVVEFVKNNPTEIPESMTKFANGHKFLTVRWETKWDNPDPECEKDYDREHDWDHSYLRGFDNDMWPNPDYDSKIHDLLDKFPEDAEKWRHDCGPFGSRENYKNWYGKIIDYLNKFFLIF